MSVKPIPEDMHTITPHIVCAGAGAAIDWYVKALGAVDLARMQAPGSDKLIHAMIKIGDSTIMLVDENPEWNIKGPKALGGTAVTLHYYVKDVDAAYKRAVDAGATAVMPPADMFWGDRYGVLTDPWGHNWSLATHVKDMTPEEMQEGMMKSCDEHAAGAKP
jgi:PhnB protein